MNRSMRRRKPAVESLEGRLAPSGGGGAYPLPGPPRDNGSWEPKPISTSSTRPTTWQYDDHGDHGANSYDGGQRDNGSWEPKPIGNSSTRPTIPTGPTGPVR